MRKHILINRNILFFQIGVFIFSIVFLFSVYVSGNNIDPNGDTALAYYMVSIMILTALAALSFLTPAIMNNNDNVMIFMNVPKKRVDILIDRYKANAFFLFLSLTIFVVVLIGITYVFDLFNMNTLISYEGLLAGDLLQIVLIIAYIIVLNKYIFTVITIENMSAFKYRKFAIVIVSIIIFFIDYIVLLEAMFSGSGYFEYFLIITYLLHVLFFICLIGIDILLYKRGEV